MKRVGADDLAAAIDRVRRGPSRELVSNYFFSPLHATQLSVWDTESSLVFLDREHQHHRVYFLSRAPDELTGLLRDLPRGPLVGDYPTREQADETMDRAFEGGGFEKAAVYQRMTNNNLSSRKGRAKVVFATERDAEALFQQLCESFDVRLDRVPEWPEFAEAVRQHRVLVRRRGGDGDARDEIEGYVVYQLQGRRALLHYWYSRPGSHPVIAVKLLTDFFSEMTAKEISASFLWAKTSLAAEIRVYEALGYAFDGLTSHVYLRD